MPFSTLRRTCATVLAAGLLSATAAGCAGETAAQTADGKTVFRYQSSAGYFHLIELADALGYLEDVELEHVGFVNGGPDDLRALATDQTDIASAFIGAAAKVSATGVPVTSVIASYGSNEETSISFLVQEDGPVKEAHDLIGKKVGVNTLGANGEAVLDTWLLQEGLTPEEVEQVTLVPLPGTALESSLREGQVEASMVGGAGLQIAMQRPGLEVLIRDVDVVGPYNGGTFALRDRFIEENPEATEEVVTALSKTIEWAAEHDIEEVRQTATDYLVGKGRKDDTAAVPYYIGTGIATEGGVLRDEDFELWTDWLVGEGEISEDQVVVEDFYTNDFNPAA